MKSSIFLNTMESYITNDQLAECINPFLPDQDGEVKVSLWDVRVAMTGYGHWKISVDLEFNDEKITLTKTTTDSIAIDNMKTPDNCNEKQDGYLSLLDECIRANEDKIMEAVLDTLEEKEQQG